MKKPDLEQFNRERTAEYRSRITLLYAGKIYLIDTGGYRGTRFKINHHCDVCGMDFMAYSSDMLMGVGCTHCKTNADKIDEVLKYEHSLYRIHGDLYTMHMRGSLARFDMGKRYVHYCRECDTTFKASPLDVLSIDFMCPLCTKVREMKTSWHDYAGRLRKLYRTGYSIQNRSKLNAVKPIKHECRICKVVWRDTMLNMLTRSSSVGCEHVHLKEVTSIHHTFNKRTYVLRSSAERVALYKVLSKIDEHDLKTALTYPIPVIPSSSGSHVPSFMDRHTGMLVDVFSLRAFNRNYAKWKAVADTALWAGLDYRVIIVNGKKVSVLPKVWVHM